MLTIQQILDTGLKGIIKKDDDILPHVEILKRGLAIVMVRSLRRLEHKSEVASDAVSVMEGWLYNHGPLPEERISGAIKKMSDWELQNRRYNFHDLTQDQANLYIAARHADYSATWALKFILSFTPEHPSFLRSSFISLTDSQNSVGDAAMIGVDIKDAIKFGTFINAKRDEWEKQKADILEVFTPLILKQ
tara:strand:+ start:3455 stop:4027 length:573 start_codon:yes stop_codon:yes gene_type:complete